MEIDNSSQIPLPFAIIKGEYLEKKPEDLYIPLKPLQLNTDIFSGPLDLLLYLIKKQNIDILDIPMVLIAEQYSYYVSTMQTMKTIDYELVGDYLLMSAMLADIKTKMLLPRQTSDDGEEDPRAELAKRLLEYQIYKEAAEKLNQLPRVDRDILLPQIEFAGGQLLLKHPDIELQAIIDAWQNVQKKIALNQKYLIEDDGINTRDCMTMAIAKLKMNQRMKFIDLLDARLGDTGAALTFYSLLFLFKNKVVDLIQKTITEDLQIELLVSNWSFSFLGDDSNSDIDLNDAP